MRKKLTLTRIAPALLLVLSLPTTACKVMETRIEVGEVKARITLEARVSPTPELDELYERYLDTDDLAISEQAVPLYEAWLAESLGIPDLASYSNEELEALALERDWTEEQVHVLDKLSDFYFFRGMQFAREEFEKADKKTGAALFQRAKAYGLMGMCANKDVRTGLARGEKFSKVAQFFKPEDGAHMNNVGGAWLRQAEIEGALSQLKAVPEVVAIYSRMIELDPYFNGSVGHFAIAGVYGALPKMLGGDIELACAHAERAMELSPDYLESRNIAAEYCYLPTGDREGYRRVLEYVMERPIGDSPLRLENRQAKEHAKRLLAEEDKRF